MLYNLRNIQTMTDFLWYSDAILKRKTFVALPSIKRKMQKRKELKMFSLEKKWTYHGNI